MELSAFSGARIRLEWLFTLNCLIGKLALDVMWIKMGVCAGARVQSDCELWLLNVNVLLNALQIIQKPSTVDTGEKGRGRDLQRRGSGLAFIKHIMFEKEHSWVYIIAWRRLRKERQRPGLYDHPPPTFPVSVNVVWWPNIISHAQSAC